MSGDQKTGSSAGRAAAALSVPEETTIDEVPTEVREAARRAFANRDRQAQVLDLVSDSLVDSAPRTGGARCLVFSSANGPAVQLAVHELPGSDEVRLEISGNGNGNGLTVLEVRIGPHEATGVKGVQGKAGHTTAGPLSHGLMTVVLELGDQRFQTAALRI